MHLRRRCAHGLQCRVIIQRLESRHFGTAGATDSPRLLENAEALLDFFIPHFRVLRRNEDDACVLGRFCQADDNAGFSDLIELSASAELGKLKLEIWRVLEEEVNRARAEMAL